MKAALIKDGQIINTILVSDGYTPQQGVTMMPYAEAIELGIPFAPQQQPLADATMIQVQVWLSRKGINPETIPQLIEQLTEDGPARWEALARWKTNPPVPADFPMVQILWQHIGPTLDITFEQAWKEILAT